MNKLIKGKEQMLVRSQLRWQTAHQHNKMMDSIWRAHAQLQCFWHILLWNLILTGTHVHTHTLLDISLMAQLRAWLLDRNGQTFFILPSSYVQLH